MQTAASPRNCRRGAKRLSSPNGPRRRDGWRVRGVRGRTNRRRQCCGLCRLRARPQGLRHEEWISGRRARPVGRHRFSARCRHGRRCARARNASTPSCCRRSTRSDESLLDAQACAKALGIRYDKVSIEPAVAGITWGLKDMFAGTEPGITEENLQSRVRGTILMAISNKFGSHGRDDRQQERNVGRLCNSLRRHERRLQSDQGSLQDGGLCAVALA